MGSSGAVMFSWVVISMVLVGSATSATSQEALLQSHTSPGRKFIDVQEACPLKFGSMHNYTIVTKRCRGPNCPVSGCCASLRDFSCPHAALPNDMSNGCAVEMFYNLNVRGRYPPGLFSTICHDSRMGLRCRN